MRLHLPDRKGAVPRGPIAFTLLELLVVLAIIGILAGITLPTIHAFKPNPGAVAARQLLDDIARARQLAMSQRTTVFMVFLPTNFYSGSDLLKWTPDQINKAKRVIDKQLIGYTFVSLRSPGDQPGRAYPRYLSAWRTLPEGSFIPLEKFRPRNQSFLIYTNGGVAFQVFGFNRTNNIPFPTEETLAASVSRPYIDFPYIAFNYLGQLVSGENEYIPIAQGSVLFTRDPTNGLGTWPYQVNENPPGNTTNTFNLVSIDWLTGRAHLERQEVR
jgi:prepilin-type N-terminal cleavage/methylation domain-containing protein